LNVLDQLKNSKNELTKIDLEPIKLFVKQQLQMAEPGHDYDHALRVYHNSCSLLEYENADIQVVLFASLLHDIADAKFNSDDETVGLKIVETFLLSQHTPNDIIKQVLFVMQNISYSKNFLGEMTPELAIVQDADRLDAIGAIGIARSFSYGGHKKQRFYDDEIKPNTLESKSHPNTINHFYEKLLLLKDRMNTKHARDLAIERHAFLELFLQHFYQEWNET